MRIKDYRVKHKVDLENHDPGHTPGLPDDKEKIKARTQENLDTIDKLQERLYAEQKHKLLLVMQAMDTGGKDGAIRHLCCGMNPAGVKVASFKAPTPQELAHDPLWRIHPHVPARGYITIFNRSHYEDVLYPRVHGQIDHHTVKRRFDHIRQFERMLADEGTTILKFFLHISKAEQKERLEARQDDPEKNWKLSPSDVAERSYWDDYQKAYADALEHTSTKYAPWFIVPANSKKRRDLIISTIVLEAMQDLDIGVPPATVDVSKIVIE